MKSLAKHLTTLFMFIATAISAQKKSESFCTWKIAAELPPAKDQAKALGVAGPVTGVFHDVLIVAGGSNFPDSMPWQNGKKKYYDEVYVYIKKNRKTVLHKKSFKLPSTIAYAAVCTTPFGILYAGGENEKGISNKVILMKWDASEEKIVFTNFPDLPVGLSNAAAAVNGNIVYLAGGETSTQTSDLFYSLDLNNIPAGWKQLPNLPQQVSHMVLAVQSNGKNACVYLVGGRKKNENGISDLYSSVYEFDFEKNQWSVKKGLPYKLCAGTGIATGNDCILMFGGDRGETFSKVQAFIAAINSEKDEVKKQELIRQKNKLQSEHPGFSKDVLLYNTVTDTWKTVGDIPVETPVTTTAVKWGKEIFIPCGEIKAGVRTPNILSVKILQKAK